MLIKKLRTFLRALTYPIYILSGISQRNTKIVILFAGSKSEKAYLSKIAFSELRREASLGRCYFWKIDGQARKHNVDIVYVRGDSFLAKIGLFSDFYFIPLWVEAEASIDKKDIEGVASKSRRRDIRKIEENGFSYRMTTSREDFDRFYKEMYLPLIKVSHGDAALFMKYEHMMALLDEGHAELILITLEGEDIAGSLVTYEKNMPRLFSEGVLNADKFYFRKGVGTAIYIFSYRYLFERGHKRVNIGRCRSFLNDGALYFKRRMGMEITGVTQQGYWLKANNYSEGAVDFLVNNPFICLDKEMFVPIVFFKKNPTETVNANNMAIPGLREVKSIEIESKVT